VVRSRYVEIAGDIVVRTMVEIAIPCFSSLCERVKRKAEMSSHIGIDPRRRSGREQSCWRRGARRAERYGRLERACIGRSTVGDPRVSCTSCSCSHAFRGRGSPGVMVARASAAARGFWQRPSFTFQATFFSHVEIHSSLQCARHSLLSTLFFHFLCHFKVPLKVPPSRLKRMPASTYLN